MSHTEELTGRLPTTVLLIDDDTFFLKILADAFVGSGFAVLTATNGNEGVRAYEAQHPDVVICDLIMPEKGGVSTCMEISKLAGEKEPIIALLTSMFKGNPRKLDLPEMGARIHIPKSIHPLSVVVLIEQLLEQSLYPAVGSH